MEKKKKEMPRYCFSKQGKIWFTYKDESGEWKNKPTPYYLGQEQLAERYVKHMYRGLKAKARGTEAGAGPVTVREYVYRWLKEREERGVSSAKTERTRMNRYVLPMLGDLALDEVRPFHVRDLVRALKNKTFQELGVRFKTEDKQKAKKNYTSTRINDKLGARTVNHIYRMLKNMFDNAIVDELVMSNPVVVKEGELPKKVDKDPEWRINATWTVHEIERLISDPVIPPVRRVLYALKSLSGMRHQEAAALCWRHRDTRAEPLNRLNIVQAYDSIQKVIKSTKTEETRAVPEHPTLTKILNVWRLEHWPRIYGRQPTEDDLVIPTRTMQCINATVACRAMKDDLDALGLRKEAGKFRTRQGHDMRSWYRTRCVEDGADSALIDRTTHAAPKDVKGGYDRYSWAAICREVAKLKVGILGGEVLQLLPDSFLQEKKAGARWSKVVTPKGLEPLTDKESSGVSKSAFVVGSAHDRSRAPTHGHEAGRAERSIANTAGRMLERAILAGDTARALRIARELSGRPSVATEPSEIDRARARRGQ